MDFSQHAPVLGPPSHAPVVGRVIAQKFRVLRRLGEGGMGTVYEAENLLTLKRVALKWLHPGVAHDHPMGRQRLLREARAMARIHHQNVVEIYDVVLEGDAVFLVMALLEGETLSAHLHSRPTTLHEVIALLLPVMRGAAAAHASGIVHRDIKPDNVLLAHDPKAGQVAPTLIDFGISHMLEEGTTRLTRSGMTMGTPRYVSYEQLNGAHRVDVRADVYAFGVMLYECAVGQPPYHAHTLAEQAIQFVTTEPDHPRTLRPELPEALCSAILDAIAKHRDARIPTMEAMLAAFTPFATADAYETALEAYPPTRPTGPTGAALPSAITCPATIISTSQEIAHTGQVPPLPTPPFVTGIRRRATRTALVSGFAILLAAAFGIHQRPRQNHLQPAPTGHAQRATQPPPKTVVTAPAAIDVGITTLTTAHDVPSAAIVAPKPARARKRVAHDAAEGAEDLVPSATTNTQALQPTREVDVRGYVVHRADPLSRAEF